MSFQEIKSSTLHTDHINVKQIDTFHLLVNVKLKLIATISTGLSYSSIRNPLQSYTTPFTLQTHSDRLGFSLKKKKKRFNPFILQSDNFLHIIAGLETM